MTGRGGQFERASLTQSQLMLWTGQRLQADDPLYNMALSFRIRGALDADVFRQAFRVAIERCDALRTTFTVDKGVPRQLFHEHFDYDVELVDLADDDDREATLRGWLRERAARPFDLNTCLFDSVLLKLADDDFVWFFNQHHLTTDASSTALVYRTVQEACAKAAAGESLDTTPCPAFSDYVRYEAKQRDSATMRRAEAYWSEILQAPLAPSSFYRAVPADRGSHTERVPCDVGSERSDAIRRLASSDGFRSMTEDLARFQVFATAYLAWLYRITGNRQLSLGTPSHNRATARQQNTVGLFIEIYPLRVTVDDNETFASLHAKVARRMTELLMNSAPGASGFEHHRAYDVVLNYITASFGDFAGMPMQSEWVHAGFGDRNHLLRMQVEDFDRDNRFRVFFDVNTDVFKGDERQRPGRQFLRVLDAFVAQPSLPVDDVDLLDDEEREQLSAGFVPAEPVGVPTDTVFDRFLDAVARHPDRIAIRCGTNELDYAALLARVESAAANLLAAGVSSGETVGIALPRSLEAVVAILAALRCGSAYLPLDPSYPRDRIAGMLEDADARRVIVSDDVCVDLPAGTDCIEITGEPTLTLPAWEPVAAETSAYVIFTSGSTGRPKGVDVTHRSLSNYIAWASRQYGEGLSWPLFSSLSFDLTVTSLFVPLTSGGQIVVYPQDPERREMTIRRVVEDNAVDIIKLTPAHLALLQVMDLSGSRIGTLVVGGENLKSALARSISRYFGGRVSIYNEYGPTEATVACMIHRFDETRDTGDVVPIGRAFDNACVYVLDDECRLQLLGVPGELYIGGEVLARGYVSQPELTDERFVANPFRPGERMYRTGDRARVNPDLTITCLGRVDEQVKVNGVRIEPGEIEATLLDHPGVGDAAVRLIERADDDTVDAQYCSRCGLDARHPDAMLDADAICRICRVYEDEAEQAQSYFRTEDDLREIVAEARRGREGRPDCMMLLSGGKDSTYALCRLVDLGLTPLVFTLDNGYISDGAKANIRRVVDQLGLELHTATTPAMNEIFVDSLHRFSNVCNGCFKTIYTLCMGLARERGIRHIFTGLSRGQIFETRVADLFRLRVFDPATIDRTIIEARKAYHRAHDAVSDNLDVSQFEGDAIFEEIEFVDFYRYTDVSLDEMLTYLRDSVPWVRPADTGRSTNCLINEAGIFVHKQERGFHNYALPYSWDVRLGHKERDAARDELDDDIDTDNVNRILAEIGYRPRESSTAGLSTALLVAYYVADAEISADALRETLAGKLPAEFMPSRFVRLDALPLTKNGKLDRAALPEPDLERPQTAGAYVAPSSESEAALARIWADVLGLDRVGVDDNFFDLGGDSIMNIRIVAAAASHGLKLSPQQVFDHPTIRELIGVIGTAAEVSSQQAEVTGPVPMTPAQHRFFAMPLDDPRCYTQQVLLRADVRVDELVLREALRRVVAQHDGLRARFSRHDDGWQQEFAPTDAVNVPVERIDAGHADDDALDALLADCVVRVRQAFDLERAPLFAATILDGKAANRVLLIAHHLVVDAVSWWILVEDLARIYRSLSAAEPVALPPKTSSMRQWARVLEEFVTTGEGAGTRSLWQQDAPAPLPTDSDGDNDLASQAIGRTVLPAGETERLMHAVTRWRLQPQDLLLTAFAQTLSGWSGSERLLIDLEAHGREPIADGVDLLRTVGWFTSVYPLALSVASDADPARHLLTVRDRLRAIPHGGVACGALRYLADDNAATSSAPLLFNYLGKWQRQTSTGDMFAFERPVMASLGGTGSRSYEFEINAAIFDRRLHIEWTYSGNRHLEKTVDGLLKSYRGNIARLVACCSEQDRPDLTPDDFPTADLSQGELDDVLAEFGEV